MLFNGVFNTGTSSLLKLFLKSLFYSLFKYYYRYLFSKTSIWRGHHEHTRLIHIIDNMISFISFQAPFDTHRLVFPVVPAAIFGVLFWLLYTSAFPKPMSLCMLGGTAMGYICYDLTHYYLHHGSPFLTYFRRLKRYHIRHHFDDQQKGKLFSIFLIHWNLFWEATLERLLDINANLNKDVLILPLVRVQLSLATFLVKNKWHHKEGFHCKYKQV